MAMSQRTRVFAAVSCFILGFGAFRWGAVLHAHAQTDTGKVTLTLLGTTDTHGHLLAWDDLTNRPVNGGLTKIATLIEQVRASEPNVVLLDSGDTIEGTPMAYYFAEKDAAAANPEIAAFNACTTTRWPWETTNSISAKR